MKIRLIFSLQTLVFFIYTCRMLYQILDHIYHLQIVSLNCNVCDKYFYRKILLHLMKELKYFKSLREKNNPLSWLIKLKKPFSYFSFSLLCNYQTLYVLLFCKKFLKTGGKGKGKYPLLPTHPPYHPFTLVMLVECTK